MDESYDPKVFNQSSIAMMPPMVPVSYPNKIPPKAVGESDEEEGEGEKTRTSKRGHDSGP